MKKLLILVCSIILVVPLGCAIKRDTMEDITIYTSSYPIEYITNYLYGKHSEIKSIYPSGVVTSAYNLTEEQLKLYSDSSLFVFNG